MSYWLKMIPLVAVLSGCTYLEDFHSRGGSKRALLSDDAEPLDPENPSFRLTVATYESCDELQKAVYDQLRVIADNDFERDLYFAKNRDTQMDTTVFADNMAAPSAAAESDNSAAAASPAGTKSGAEESFTNNQEKGIDEPDYIKVGSAQIFTIRDQLIEVVDRESLSYTGRLDINGLQNLVMYAPMDKLILVGQGPAATQVRIYRSIAGSLPELEREVEFPGNYLDSRFTGGHLVLVMRDELKMIPEFETYESVEIDVWTDVQSAIQFAKARKDLDKRKLNRRRIAKQPLLVQSGKTGSISCNQIVKRPFSDRDFGLTSIARIDVNNADSEPQVAAALGAGNQIYMSNQSLYIIKSGVNWQPWQRPSSTQSPNIRQNNGFQLFNEASVVMKANINPESGDFGIVAAGMVMGVAKDQYAFKEFSKDGLLAVATTTSTPLPTKDEDQIRTSPERFINDQATSWPRQQGEETRGRNHMWVLGQEGAKLKTKRVIFNYGKPGEDIRSVRFINDYAYVVTFKKTDPLYAFNMTDPKNFELVGELEIPGFSLYMHPASDGLLLGLGYDASEHGNFALFQGIQFSLFDIRDPQAMSRLDNKIHGERGSYSEVTHDPHAFFASPEDQLYGFPVVELGESAATNSQFRGSNVQFSGAILYKVEGNSLQEHGRISHADMIPRSCLDELGASQWWQNETVSVDINRIFKVDGQLLSVSRYGIKRFDLDDLKTPVAKSAFPAGNSSCFNWPRGQIAFD